MWHVAHVPLHACMCVLCVVYARERSDTICSGKEKCTPKSMKSQRAASGTWLAAVARANWLSLKVCLRGARGNNRPYYCPPVCGSVQFWVLRKQEDNALTTISFSRWLPLDSLKYHWLIKIAFDIAWQRYATIPSTSGQWHRVACIPSNILDKLLYCTKCLNVQVLHNIENIYGY